MVYAYILVLIFEPSIMLKTTGAMDHIEFRNEQSCLEAKKKIEDDVSINAYCVKK